VYLAATFRHREVAVMGSDFVSDGIAVAVHLETDDYNHVVLLRNPDVLYCLWVCFHHCIDHHFDYHLVLYRVHVQVVHHNHVIYPEGVDQNSHVNVHVLHIVYQEQMACWWVGMVVCSDEVLQQYVELVDFVVRTLAYPSVVA
jgi:hypothetical protein